MLRFTPRPLYLLEKISHCLSDRRLDVPTRQSGISEEEKYLLPLPGIESQFAYLWQRASDFGKLYI
jgi:hypothetical protein